MREHQKETIARYRGLYPEDTRGDAEIWDAIERVRHELRYRNYHVFRQVAEGEWDEASLRRGRPPEKGEQA